MSVYSHTNLMPTNYMHTLYECKRAHVCIYVYVCMCVCVVCKCVYLQTYSQAIALFYNSTRTCICNNN